MLRNLTFQLQDAASGIAVIERERRTRQVPAIALGLAAVLLSIAAASMWA